MLEIRRRRGNALVYRAELPLKLSGVEDMFRFKNMLAAGGTSGGYPSRMQEPSNNPDALLNGKNLVFVHGYNNNPNDARDRMCEIFKRTYWSGAHAKFYAINWYGWESQAFGFSCNYHVNVEHAFQTAGTFAGFVNSDVGGDVTVWAHSLGNVLVGSAICRWHASVNKWLMVNAAMAIETLDATAYTNDMVHEAWDGYDARLRASEWYDRFEGSGDERATLTWRGLFAGTGATRIYNFYSSGEDVLVNIPHHRSLDVGYPWGSQEKSKGRMWDGFGWFGGSVYCGWGFTSDHSYCDRRVDADGRVWWDPWGTDLANQIPSADLMTRPFFRDGPSPDLFASGEPGSQYAEAHRGLLLARAIPATSFAAGANPIDTLNAPSGQRNFNMEKTGDDLGLQNGWPRRQNSRWRHGDYRDVAYVYTYKLFDKIVELEESP